MRKGSIVYYKSIYFKDGEVDIKQNRPCVIIGFSRDKVYSLPVTSSTKAYNKNWTQYYLMPQPVYNSELSYIKLDTILEKRKDETFETGIIGISEENIDKTIEKLLRFNRNLNKRQSKYDIDKIINNILVYEHQQKTNNELGRVKCKKHM
jgi:hypothetical protein